MAEADAVHMVWERRSKENITAFVHLGERRRPPGYCAGAGGCGGGGAGGGEAPLLPPAAITRFGPRCILDPPANRSQPRLGLPHTEVGTHRGVDVRPFLRSRSAFCWMDGTDPNLCQNQNCACTREMSADPQRTDGRNETVGTVADSRRERGADCRDG